MPSPLALCLEDLDPKTDADRYLRCFAVVGRTAGLGLDPAARVVWQSREQLGCELWVSADDRLILYRPEGAPTVVVRRAGRWVEAPVGKPVVLVDQDEVELAGRRCRVHVHGASTTVKPPAPLRRLAAAVALSAAAAGCTRVEVRDNPPSVAVEAPPPARAAAVDAGPAVDAGAKPPKPIEVRETPPRR